MENEKLHFELTFLKSQINPHFLFNNLNNIYALALKKDDRAPEMILNLSNILQYTLYDSDSEKVSLKEELAFVSSYIALEKIRHMDGKVVINVTGELIGVRVIPFVLTTLVENAFKHGVARGEKEAYDIRIEVTVDAEWIDFEVLNTVPEVRTVSTRKGGVGLANMKHRLAIYYPDKHTYRIEQSDEQYTAHVKIARK